MGIFVFHVIEFITFYMDPWLADIIKLQSVYYIININMANFAGVNYSQACIRPPLLERLKSGRLGQVAVLYNTLI